MIHLLELKYFSWLIPISSILFIIPLWAQIETGCITGFIYDVHKRPIQHVSIRIMDSKHFAQSDDRGFFKIENLVVGIYSLKINHISFESQLLNEICVKKHTTTLLDTIFLFSKIYQSEKITVTDSDSKDIMPKSFNQTSNVKNKAMLFNNPKTTAEALREEHGIFIQKTGHGGGSAILRGLGSNRILLLVDGIRVNNSIYRLGNHQYLTTIDYFLAKDIEVTFGPSSVLYGSDAMGGSINIKTSNPVINSDNDIGFRMAGRLASADNEQTVRSEANISLENMGIKLGIGLKKYGDLRRGKNSKYPQLEKSTNGFTQSPSGFFSYDFDAKILTILHSKIILTLSMQHTTQEKVPRYDKYENDEYILWQYHPQKRTLLYGNIEYQADFSWLRNLEMIISLHRQEEGRLIQKDAESDQINELDRVNTIGISLKSKTPLKYHQINIGAEFYYDWVESTRETIDGISKISLTSERGRYPNNATYLSSGIFIIDNINLSKKLAFQVGGRYQNINTEFLVAENFVKKELYMNYSAILGELGISYYYDDYIQIDFNSSQGFRSPNLSDLAKIGESKGNIYEVPNYALKPEKILGFESRFDLHLSRIKFITTFYYSAITDIIDSYDTNYNGKPFININDNLYKVKSKQNRGKSTIRGVDAFFLFNFYKNFSFCSFITYTYGYNYTHNEPVGGIPPLFGKFEFSWNTQELTIKSRLRFASKQDLLSKDDMDDPRIPPGGTPGWHIFNLRMRYNWLTNIACNFSVENIFDTNYREHGSGINGAGRNIILGIDMTF